MEKEKTPTFPITFDKCPVCGSTEAVIKAELEAKGIKTRLGIQAVVPLFDPLQAVLQLTTEVLIVQSDICAVCHIIYPFAVVKGQGVVNLMAQGRQFGGRPPTGLPFGSG